MTYRILTAAVAAICACNSYAGTVTSDDHDIIIKSNGGLEISTADKQYKFKVGGRLQWDYNVYDHADIGGGEGSGTELRRGRIELEGVVKKDWSYKFQLEMAADEDDDGSNSVDLEDAFIQYTGLPAYIKLGRFKIPVGLEELTSSKNISTIERAAFWDFVPSSRADLSLETGQNGSNYSWRLGIYENQGDLELGIKDSSRNLTYSYGGRVTWNPVNANGNLVHLGFSTLMTDYDDAAPRARLRSRFGVHTSDAITLADAGETGKDSSQYGFEGAWVRGPFSLQAEYMVYELTTNAADIEFDGFYLQGTYSLTGESRGYKNGAFDKIKPVKEFGALELVAKYEMGGVDHGAITNDYDSITLGVNWYFNEYVRFAVNYLTTQVEGNTSEEDGDAFTLRTQFAF